MLEAEKLQLIKRNKERMKRLMLSLIFNAKSGQRLTPVSTCYSVLEMHDFTVNSGTAASIAQFQSEIGSLSDKTTGLR